MIPDYLAALLAALVWGSLAAPLLRTHGAGWVWLPPLGFFLLALVPALAPFLLWLGLGGFSLTSGLLALSVLLIGHWPWSRPLLPAAQRRILVFVMPPLAALIWLPALGWGPGDLWALGLGDFRLSTMLLCVGLGLWVIRAYTLCLLLVAAQCAFAVGLLPAANLWQYLVDPWLGLALFVAWLWWLWRPPVTAVAHD